MDTESFCFWILIKGALTLVTRLGVFLLILASCKALGANPAASLAEKEQWSRSPNASTIQKKQRFEAQPVSPSSAETAFTTFKSEETKDLPLRTLGSLQVYNTRGRIEVRGWSQDKIRVRIKKRAKAKTLAGAREHFKRMGISYKDHGRGRLELRADYGKALNITQRLKEKRERLLEIDLVILAPSKLKLRLWSDAGALVVRDWKARLQIFSKTGSIHVQSSEVTPLEIKTDSSVVKLGNLKGSIHATLRAGEAFLSRVFAKKIFLEGRKTTIRLDSVAGNQMYVSESGAIRGNRLSGVIDFSTQSADVQLLAVRGLVSGRSKTGKIYVELRELSGREKGMLESQNGMIELTLPRRYEGMLDLQSGAEKPYVEFPIQSDSNVAQSDTRRILGQVGRARTALGMQVRSQFGGGQGVSRALKA